MVDQIRAVEAIRGRWDSGLDPNEKETEALFVRIVELEDALTAREESDRAAQLMLSQISSGWKLGCVEAESERDRLRVALGEAVEMAELMSKRDRPTEGKETWETLHRIWKTALATQD